MLVHIHFQKWPLQFLKTKYIYHKTIEVWNLDWKTDSHCKIKETLFIQELKPSPNVNISSEKLLLF